MDGLFLLIKLIFLVDGNSRIVFGKNNKSKQKNDPRRKGFVEENLLKEKNERVKEYNSVISALKFYQLG